jgi:galactitol-specific phosphotransferase system IIB component
MIPFNERRNERDERDEDDDDKLDTGLFAPSGMDARWLWDYDYLWLTFEANLRGGKLKRNSVTQNWEMVIPKDAQPFMNERGIKDILALMRANVNVITGSSIMMEDRVLMWCERMQKDLSDMLYIHMKDYELDDAKYLIIISTFMAAFEGNLRKSIGGRALIMATQSERRLIQEQITPKQAGLIGRIFGSR